MKSFGALYTGVIVPASALLPVIAGLIFYKKINKPLKTLLLYLVVSQVINIAGIVLSSYHTNNLPLLHVYTIVELVLLTLYYRHAWDDERVNRWSMIIMISFPILCVINFTFFQSIYQFNTYTRPLEALIIIVFSSLYLAYQSEIKKPELVTRSGRIVAGGLLLYFCSSLFQFIFSNVVSHTAPKSVRLMIWNIHATFVLIEYLFFFAAILNERNKR